MKLSVVVPIYNERSTIEKVLQRLEALAVDKEVLVVDDGSTDGSRDFLQQRAGGGLAGGVLKVFFHPVNRGKGAAIRTALEHVEGDVVVIQDADLEYDPAQLPPLLEPFADGSAHVVYGSRFRGSIAGMRWPNWLANKILTWTANILYGAGLTDEATGYKLFRADVLRRMTLRCERFEFCPEVTAKVRKLGYPIVERPLHGYVARHVDKKITWTDGFSAFWVLVRERFRA